MSFETKEDIVREMRMGAIGDMPFAYQVGIADTIEEFPSGAKMRKINIKKVTVKELADRFEEAFKHEKVNAGALLKALKEIRRISGEAVVDESAFRNHHRVTNINSIANTALIRAQVPCKESEAKV